MTKRVLRPPRIHHCRGWGRIGPKVRLWCTCGWRQDFEGPESIMEARWEEHLKSVEVENVTSRSSYL